MAAFVPAVLAQAGGQALFVACTAAFATQQTADPRRLLAGAFAGVLLKVGGQAGAAAIQATWVARVGQRVRSALLSGPRVGKSLRRPGQRDHGRGSLETEVPAELAARVDDVERGVGEGLLPSIRALVELLPLLVLVAWTVPRFAVLALLVLLPFVLWLGRTKRALGVALAAQSEARARLLGAFDDAVRHDDLWRVHGASARVRQLVDGAARDQGAAAARLSARTELASGQNEALGVVFVWLCVVLAPDMTTAPGLLLRFLAAFFLTYKPLRQLVTARAAWSRGRAAWLALDLSLDAESSEPPARAWSPGVLTASLQLPHGSPAPVTLCAAPGSLVLVTGPSGAGKTTLLRSLLGLRAARGRLDYAGVDLVDAGVGPAHRPFAWMPQACPVVGASVDDALLASGPIAYAELLAGVAGDAHTLSGGEAQRVALVRALSTPLPVVLLDEPTSQLDDALSERLVDLLDGERARGRTFVVVTHEPTRFRRLANITELSIGGHGTDYARGEAAE